MLIPGFGPWAQDMCQDERRPNGTFDLESGLVLFE